MYETYYGTTSKRNRKTTSFYLSSKLVLYKTRTGERVKTEDVFLFYDVDQMEKYKVDLKSRTKTVYDVDADSERSSESDSVYKGPCDITKVTVIDDAVAVFKIPLIGSGVKISKDSDLKLKHYIIDRDTLYLDTSLVCFKPGDSAVLYYSCGNIKVTHVIVMSDSSPLVATKLNGASGTFDGNEKHTLQFNGKEWNVGPNTTDNTVVKIEKSGYYTLGGNVALSTAVEAPVCAYLELLVNGNVVGKQSTVIECDFESDEIIANEAYINVSAPVKLECGDEVSLSVYVKYVEFTVLAEGPNWLSVEYDGDKSSLICDSKKK